jgi:hypothetical protein
MVCIQDQVPEAGSGENTELQWRSIWTGSGVVKVKPVTPKGIFTKTYHSWIMKVRSEEGRNAVL